MSFVSLLWITLLLWTTWFSGGATAFAPRLPNRPSCQLPKRTSLYAIGALVKKAKQAELRNYVKAGVPDDVMEYYNTIKSKLDSVDLQTQQPGPLQQSLTKRKGTITVIAEYRRKLSTSGFINDSVYDPETLSPLFRGSGASAVAVLADTNMGGCSYDDVSAFVEEQRRARSQVPGPIPIINNDLILDELQVARSAACKVGAIVLQLDLLKDTNNLFQTLLQSAYAVDLEVIVAVSNAEDAQAAVDLGARMLLVDTVEGGAPAKAKVIENVKVPEQDHNNNNDSGLCFIANIAAENNNQLSEIEQAWAVRDAGFQAVWVGEALYKGGADETEHPGAIIKAMKAKSSLKWASPKAKAGRGEGAREYLGDIMM